MPDLMNDRVKEVVNRLGSFNFDDHQNYDFGSSQLFTKAPIEMVN